MTGLSTSSASIDGRAAGRDVSPRRVGLRTGIAAATAAAMLGFGLQGPSRPARGGDDDPSSKRPAPRAAFIGEIRRTLKADDIRLIALANQVLEDPGASGGLEDQLDRLRIDAIKAEGDYQYATSKREIAEMALKEYTEALLPRDLAAAEGELSIAQAAMAKARDQAQEAKGDVPKITARLEEQKATLALEQADMNKKFLEKFGKSHRTKELQSQLAMARSEERGKRAEWERVKGRIDKALQVAAARRRPPEVEKRLLALLDAAIPIEEQAHAGLERFSKERHPGDAVEAELRDLTNRLGAILDEAEAVKATDDLARLKPRLGKSARPDAEARSR